MSATFLPSALAPVISKPGANGIIRFTKSADNVVIGPCVLTDGYRAIETDQGVTLRRLRVNGVTGRNLQRDGIRLRRADDCEIANFDFSMRAEPQTGSHLPEGIAIYAGSDILIRDGKVSGFRMADEIDPNTGKLRYRNGDGVAVERDVTGLRIRNVIAEDNSDGGFDLKPDCELENLTAIRNGKGFRIWGKANAGLLTSVDNGAAVHLAGGSSLVVERLVCRSDRPAPVIVVEGGATLVIKSADLTSMPKGSTLVQYNGRNNSITLGEGCVLPS